MNRPYDIAAAPAAVRVPVRRETARRGPRRLAAVLLALLVATAAAYALGRAADAYWTRQALAGVADGPRLQTAHFTVYYRDGDRQDAATVADALEAAYPVVASDLGSLPAERIPVRVETAEGLAANLGGDARDAPLGAYWRDVLWFLRPSEWIPGDPAQEREVFVREGPAAHELAHLAVDRRGAGRTPAWLDEGIAQYEQYRATGFVWREPANDLTQPLYTWADLEGRFDRLPNQALAYRQAFLAVRAIAGDRPDRLRGVLDRIGSGEAPDRAVADVVGPAAYAGLRAGDAWRR
jgi:hypothetical protein